MATAVQKFAGDVNRSKVVQMRSAGKTLEQIAGELDLSERTVERYLSSAREKLGVSSRVELGRMPADGDDRTSRALRELASGQGRQADALTTLGRGLAATAKGLEANAGLFTYPMLMAADILLYDTDVVPVGADQRQHVEYAREAAAKFNVAFGDTFKEPQEKIVEAIATVPGTDGKKMSKSYGNTIPLFGTKDEIAKAVMSIVTDSTGDRPEHVHAIHKHFRSGVELESLYTTHAGKYKNLKEALIEDIDAMIAPMREVRNAITDDDVRSILREGAAHARTRAAAKMQLVRERVGVTI